jgi:hypothetical protein
MALSVLLLTAASASEAHGRHKASANCLSPHSRLLLADAQAMVYVKQSALGNEQVVFGCAFRRPGVYRLGGVAQCGGGGSGCSGINEERLAGTMIAFQTIASASGESGTAPRYGIVVKDLLSGHVIHSAGTGTPARVFPEQLGIGLAEGLVLNSRGDVAWIARGKPEDGPDQVHAVNRSGDRMLAEGQDIEPGSIALAGTTLYWTQGGRPASAPLS